MATVTVDTARRTIFYRDFTIEESIDGWEWTHEDFRHGVPVTGLCQTVFECIEAVNDWHDQREAA